MLTEMKGLRKGSIMRTLLIASAAILALGVTGQAFANPCPPGNPPTNCAPPPGALLDLAGTAVPHSYQPYSVSFTATQASTNLSFSMREDPAFLSLDDVSVVDTTTSSSNLVVNGGFEGGGLGT